MKLPQTFASSDQNKRRVDQVTDKLFVRRRD